MFFTDVCLSIGEEGRVSLVPGLFWGVGYLWSHVASGGRITREVGYPGVGYFSSR